MFKKVMVLVAALAAVPAIGSAASLSFNGGTSFATPSNFDLNRSLESVDLGSEVVFFSAPSTGSIGGGLELDSKASLEFTFIGKEAAAFNTFFLGSGGEALTTRSTLGSTLSGAFSSGSIDFGFDTLLNGSIVSILNGGASGFAGLGLAFSEIFNGGKSVYALFDDGRGDNDLDDMVVRIDVIADISEVPLPAGAVLMGTALAAFGFARRRRKN